MTADVRKRLTAARFVEADLDNLAPLMADPIVRAHLDLLRYSPATSGATVLVNLIRHLVESRAAIAAELEIAIEDDTGPILLAVYPEGT